jgi:hypothetical protein
MEEFTKELRPAEIKRHCVCIPKERQHLFPPVGGKLVLRDDKTGSTHEVAVGSQCRLVMHTWFTEHPEIRAGDTTTFSHDNGAMSLKLTSKRISRAAEMFERRKGGLSIFEGKVLDLVIQALADIEKGGIDAIVRVSATGISIEWGKHIRSTKIILGEAEVSL